MASSHPELSGFQDVSEVEDIPPSSTEDEVSLSLSDRLKQIESQSSLLEEYGGRTEEEDREIQELERLTSQAEQDRVIWDKEIFEAELQDQIKLNIAKAEMAYLAKCREA